MLNLKKLIRKEAEKAIVNKAVGKILPMEDAPKLTLMAKIMNVKGRLTVAIAAVAALVAAVSELM
jgi:hypothetical protein